MTRRVGLTALVFSALYLVSDVIEGIQGGFSTGQLWLTLAAEAAIPVFVIGLYVLQRPQIGALGRVGAVAYAYSYVFFTGTVVYALIDQTSDYTALSDELRPWMLIHGAIMVLAGLCFGSAVIRARVLPRWTGIVLMVGVVLVAFSQNLPEAAQVLAAAVRDLGFAGMGAALLRGRTSHWGTRMHAALYRITSGRLLGRVGGQPVLLLQTLGRRSGRRRTTPLQYLRDGEAFIVVAANGGAALAPAWYSNLRADARARVQCGARTLDVRVREASGSEHAALWQRLTVANRYLGRVARKAGRDLPILVLAPTEVAVPARLSDPHSSPAAVELYWIPLGAGGHSVRVNGRVFEAIAAARRHRRRCDLYHAALVVELDRDRYTIELAPSPNSDEASRGVVATGAVGSRSLGWLRLFRYEVRCWRGGSIPDLGDAVGGPRRLSSDPRAARRVLDLVAIVPTPVWGRDELNAGEMWNSNSVTAWLIATAGLSTDALRPPQRGRAPGWHAGLEVSRRSGAYDRRHDQPWETTTSHAAV